MVLRPGARPVASPWDPSALEILASTPLDEDHVTLLVRFWVVRLEKTPVAVNCWVWPAAREVTAGDTVMAVSTAGSTVRADVPLTRADGSVAVMVLRPGARPVASPWDPSALEILASTPLDEDHVTLLVRFWVVRLEKTPVAVNCWVWPAAREVTAGDTVMERSTGAPRACAESATPTPSNPEIQTAERIRPPIPSVVLRLPAIGIRPQSTGPERLST